MSCDVTFPGGIPIEYGRELGLNIARIRKEVLGNAGFAVAQEPDPGGQNDGHRRHLKVPPL